MPCSGFGWRIKHMQQERPVSRTNGSTILHLAGLAGLCLLVAASNLRPALTSLATMLAENSGKSRDQRFLDRNTDDAARPVLRHFWAACAVPLGTPRHREGNLHRVCASAAALALRLVNNGLFLIVSTLIAGAAIGVWASCFR